ncbi:MAG: ABC transporter ATP-binding protein [Clostridia bacterium]|nr:ABC transporter ATP-binding protein [Clostridia bacterium]
MTRLLKYLKGYTKESILGPLLKLLEATLELIVPLIIAMIVDYGIMGDGGSSYVIWMSLLLVLFGAIGLAFSVTAQYFCAKASVGFVARVRSALFGKIQTLSYTDIDRIGTSTMITRMTGDASKVQNGLNLALRLLLRSPFVVFGAMIMAFVVDPTSATSFAVVIPVLSVVVFGIMLISMPLYKRSQAATDGILLKTRENLAGARVIRAFCMENAETESFSARNDALTGIQKRVGMISSLLNPLTYVIINLAILWLMELGAIQVDSGNLTAGEVLALYNYMSQILVELIKLANLIISITRALASASRIADVLDIESTEVSGNVTDGSDSEYSVEMRGVSLTYSGAGAPSVSGIDLSVRHGETVGIIGSTGSGKTSLINLIPGFYPATEGAVLIDGTPVGDYSTEALRERIGVVPQKAVLFRGSVRDNMKLGHPDASDEDVIEALKTAQVYDVVMDKGGLDAEIEEGGQNLSGGQKQRLTIARALVGKPSILILDDSASALDYATDAALRRAIREMQGEATVFIVSQRTSSIMHADKILVLEDGEAIGMGTHGELLNTCEVYREIHESQFGGGAVNG